MIMFNCHFLCAFIGFFNVILQGIVFVYSVDGTDLAKIFYKHLMHHLH